MNHWETHNEKQLLDFLVGDWYGENPEDNLNVIRQDKADRASLLCEKLQLNARANVLEIGSGMGFTSKHVAKNVKHLYCCDISDSFLTHARQECYDVANISFYKIERQGVLPFENDFFDCVYSDAVFIHLNLYDIFWYFSAFKKVVKPNGIVWFNIMNASPVMMNKLAEMANYYREDPSCLKNLLCWNSDAAIISTGSYFGFELVSKETDANVNLTFRKLPV